MKYGAWYLNPKTWKKQKDGESLEDPEKQQENTLSEAKIESEKLVRVCFTNIPISLLQIADIVIEKCFEVISEIFLLWICHMSGLLQGSFFSD